jgi:signal transduction histidine kinase
LAARKPGLDAFIGHAADILDGGQRLLSAVEEMLELARIDAGRIRLDARSIDAEKVLTACRRMIADEAARRGISITIAAAPGGPTIWADEPALRKVLLNLLSNGLKFTPRGGRITCSAAAVTGDRVRLTVADTGVGIPADRLSGLFEPFTQLDASYRREAEGAGIGLALARELVEHMGGRIAIRSTVGQGTVVDVDLPTGRIGRL